MNILGIVQARTGSSRLPGKVLMRLGDVSLVEYQLRRVVRSRLLNNVVLATSEDDSDNELAEEISKAGFEVFRGDLSDVLDRYRACSELYNASIVVRLTGDCPLSDPVLIDEVITEFLDGGWDYLSNSADPNGLSVPDGFDVEVFKASLLGEAAEKAELRSEREHVTPWFRSKSANLKWGHFKHKPIRPYYRVTVDEKSDYTVVTTIVEALKADGKDAFGVDDVVEFLDKNPDIAAMNLATLRNEGGLRSLSEDVSRNKTGKSLAVGEGQKLWERAKKVIPGGNMLLSKRAELFLPGKWPAYFSRAKGCRVWDLEGREYIDMSTMGVGTNLLGYGHPEVDAAAAAAVASGNMSSLNCPEEVWLAEKLVEIHPWADMARFARSGGEANAIAIRIARAATGRDTVAVCGYHGWHDWYLATNIKSNRGLDQHLLPGLSPTGVPKEL